MVNQVTSIETTTNQAFSITDNAAKRIETLAKKESENAFLRIEVLGGGCSGFQYNMDFDTNLKQDDAIFENGSAKVAIDPISLPLLSGSKIDYVETLGAAAFEIKNPNASSSCGCGNSFSV